MQEGSTLQSALCAALSSIWCPWPAIIPMHDPLRDACWGVAVTCSGTSAFLDSDSIHISDLPEKLLHVSYTPFSYSALKHFCPFGLRCSKVWLCSLPICFLPTPQGRIKCLRVVSLHNMSE